MDRLNPGRGAGKDRKAPLTPRIGPKIKHTRLLKGLTLRDLADAAGCSKSLLSKIENGRANPSLKMIHRVIRAKVSELHGAERSAHDLGEVHDSDAVERESHARNFRSRERSGIGSRQEDTLADLSLRRGGNHSLGTAMPRMTGKGRSPALHLRLALATSHFEES